MDRKNRDDILCWAMEHNSSTMDVRSFVRHKKEEAAKAAAQKGRSASPSPSSDAVQDQDDSTNGGDGHRGTAEELQLSIRVDDVELVEEVTDVSPVEDTPDSKPQGEIVSTPQSLVIYPIVPLEVFMAVKSRFTIEQMIELESLCHQHNNVLQPVIEVEPITKSVKKKNKANKQDEPAALVDTLEDSTDDVPVRTLDEQDVMDERSYEESEDYRLAIAALESGVPSDDVE